MAKITGIQVINFRSLKDLTMGQLWSNSSTEPLAPITALIGKNGVGKSALLDVFAFLSDTVKFGADEACYMRNRGGFNQLRTQGQAGAIEIRISYTNDSDAAMSYSLSIDSDNLGRTVINKEALLCRDKQKNDDSVLFLVLDGISIMPKADHPLGYDQAFQLIKDIQRNKATSSGSAVEIVELDNKNTTGISLFRELSYHAKIIDAYNLISGCHLTSFNFNEAVQPQEPSTQLHLKPDCSNIASVVDHIKRTPEGCKALDEIFSKLYGISAVSTEKSKDGMLLLQFHDSRLETTFYAAQTSAGTMRYFAYLLLLSDAEPTPIICFDNPETGLHHKQLEKLVSELRANVSRTQFFMTTHQPHLIDFLDPEEVWILEKDENGFTTVTRASDMALIKGMVNEGLPLGGVWYSDYFDA